MCGGPRPIYLLAHASEPFRGNWCRGYRWGPEPGVTDREAALHVLEKIYLPGHFQLVTGDTKGTCLG